MPKPLPVLEPMSAVAACCPPLMEAPLSAPQAEDLSARLKALADPTRLRLLSLMLASPGLEPTPVTSPTYLTCARPTITHHMRKLAAAGLIVRDRRVGNFTYYRVVTETLDGLAVVISPTANN